MQEIALFLPILLLIIFVASIILVIVIFIRQSNIFVDKEKLEDKYYLKSQIKSTGTAYLLLFIFGFHYIYMNKLILQILYWFTLGGLGIWTIIDLITLANRISTHNALLYRLIDEIEVGEKVFNAHK
jgi:hypothetical protein